MWKQAVEQILRDAYESALKKIRALEDSDDVVLLTSCEGEASKCEAIIAKGKRENMRCNAKTQPGTVRCKTHSKSKIVSTTAAVEEPRPTLVSDLEPDTVFGCRNVDGTIVFDVRPDNHPEDLF